MVLHPCNCINGCRFLWKDDEFKRSGNEAINRNGLADPAQLKAVQDTFFKSFAWDGAKKRIPVLIQRGIGKPGEFELNLGRNVGNLVSDSKRSPTAFDTPFLRRCG